MFFLRSCVVTIWLTPTFHLCRKRIPTELGETFFLNFLHILVFRLSVIDMYTTM